MIKAELVSSQRPQRPQRQTELMKSVQDFFRIHVVGEYHTTEEKQEAVDSRERVKENTRIIQKHLPPSTHADHTRMTW